MATINLGNIRFNWCGEYSETTTYYQDDVVGCNGSCYIAKKTNKGISTADRDKWDLMVAGAGNPYALGEQKLMPFRASELPPGWYFRNGDNYLLNSPQGQVLNQLSDNYKRDHQITIKDINGQKYINVPSAFAQDGRGYFERAIDGTSRQVGDVEGDSMRQLNGSFLGFNETGNNIDNMFYADERYIFDASGSQQNRALNLAWNVFDNNRVNNPVSNENRPLNIGLTPAIYLGV